LHRLGDSRLDVSSDSALVTRRKDGSLVIAVWNLFLPEESGSLKTVTLHFKGSSKTSASISIVDKQHGSPLPLYQQLGSPASPTPAQIAQLRKAAALPTPQTHPIANGSLSITLQPHALALIEIPKL
jgi:xylan 1,4-beta-xylosidase